MPDRLELAVREAAVRLLPRDTAALVAVSGGADSVALLHLLHGLRRRLAVGLAVAHLDHGLRPGSAADRRFVERLAADLGLACVADRREVAALRRRDESPEEAARRVRRAFLLEAARATDARRVATGHTLDDQAETILMRLGRGGGARALTGMAEAGPGPFVRPLLGVERAALRDWLDRRGLPHREDPTNRDLRYDRNRVRHLVVPALAAAINPRAAANLVRAAARLREDATYLDGLAARAYRRLSEPDGHGGVALPAGPLARTAGPVARRLARLALDAAGADPRRVGARHVEALLALAGPGGRREVHLPGGLVGRRDGDRVVVEARGRAD